MTHTLKKGNSISITSTNVGTPTVNFNYVLLENEVVGIGIFLDQNEECLSAIIRNSKGEKEVISELTSKHPSDRIAREELERLFDLNFQ
ncbi:hypothetical protein [Sphingobacterium multivorum]|uniref:hypothetical protein n=1 Tax=Sphingobacterium multivorum TaxID=28454 RepID=UPI0028A80DD4|nr:hypothetical protein [Sphingobacterium multivorum]